MNDTIRFHLPIRPYDPITAHNRTAAAHGSPGYALATAHADYNGHHVSLTWNDSGRVVLARGSFADCLRAVLSEYARGALGSSASVSVRAGDAAALEIAKAEPLLVDGGLPSQAPWWTRRHDVGAQSAPDRACPGPRLIFDWDLCQAAGDREAYDVALRAKYGSTYA